MKDCKKLTKWIAIGVITIVFIGMLVSRVVDLFDEPDTQQQPLAVHTQVVKEGDLKSEAMLTGSIEGATSSIISSPISGQVVQIYVDDGSMVSVGDPLFKLDTVELNNVVIAANNALYQVEAKYDQANTNFHRYETLVRQGAISQQQMDAARTDLIAAQTEVDSARANVSTAAKRVDDATVRALSDGVVANRNLTIGQNVGAGVQVMTVEAISTVNAVIQIPQKWMKDIKIGDTVDITIDTYPNRVFKGTISVINPVAGVENRMFRVKVTIPNSEGLIKPGMFVSVKMTDETPVKAIMVPKTAIVQEKGLSYIFVVDGNQAKRVSVEVGELQADNIQIVKGLHVGDRIILDQTDRLQDKALISWKEEG